jgi:hypothetical protein
MEEKYSITKITQEEIADFIERALNSNDFKNAIKNGKDIEDSSRICSVLGLYLTNYATATGDLSNEAISKIIMNFNEYKETVEGSVTQYENKELGLTKCVLPLINEKWGERLGLDSTNDFKSMIKIAEAVFVHSKNNEFYTHSFNGALLKDINTNGLNIKNEKFIDEYKSLILLNGKDSSYQTGKLFYCELSENTFSYALGSPERLNMLLSDHDGKIKRQDDETQYDYYKRCLQDKIDNATSLTEEQKSKIISDAERMMDFYYKKGKSSIAIWKQEDSKEISIPDMEEQIILEFKLLTRNNKKMESFIKKDKELYKLYKSLIYSKDTDINQIQEFYKFANEKYPNNEVAEGMLQDIFTEIVSNKCLNNFKSSYGDGYIVDGGILDRDSFSVATFDNVMDLYAENKKKIEKSNVVKTESTKDEKEETTDKTKSEKESTNRSAESKERTASKSPESKKEKPIKKTTSKSVEIDDLLKKYRSANKSKKQQILKDLGKTKKFGMLINKLMPDELVEMAKIHPSKEDILDTMISDMENHSKPTVSTYILGNDFRHKKFEEFKEALYYKTPLQKITERIKGLFSKTPALLDNISKKLGQIEELSKYEIRRTYATGKKIEQLENQDLDQAVDKSRVEINNGEMAKVFDRFAKPARKKGTFTEMYTSKESAVAQNLKLDLKEEYTKILGNEKSDIAELVANQEYESFSGTGFYVPYRGEFSGSAYDGIEKPIGGVTDRRRLQKNLLEIEKVEDFTVADRNLGEVFIVKSEISPTSYAIEGKWAPVYEYFSKNENGEFIRIGSGKISKKTGRMESLISTDGQNISGSIKYDERDVIDKGKKEGTILQFDNYSGNSTKTSRKDIEQAIAMRSIQEYLGSNKKIADITQIKDMPIIDYDMKGNPDKKNAYVVASVESGRESYEIVYMDENGKCQTYPGIREDIFNKQTNIHFPTATSTGISEKSLNILDVRKSLETLKNSEDKQFSVYRDKEGILRVAEIIPRKSGNGVYAEELDSYSLVHENMEKVKEETKDQIQKGITLQKAKSKYQTTTQAREEDDGEIDI